LRAAGPRRDEILYSLVVPTEFGESHAVQSHVTPSKNNRTFLNPKVYRPISQIEYNHRSGVVINLLNKQGGEGGNSRDDLIAYAFGAYVRVKTSCLLVQYATGHRSEGEA